MNDLLNEYGSFHQTRPAKQPCPDTFLFHIVTPKFCDSLIKEMENNGGWSNGKNDVTDNLTLTSDDVDAANIIIIFPCYNFIFCNL